MTQDKAPVKIYLEWWDHASTMGWHHSSELGDANSNGMNCALRPMLNKTVGWLIKEDKLSIYVSHSVTEQGIYCDPIVILKNNVTTRKKL